MLEGLYDAVSTVLQLPPIIIGELDYSPLIIAIVSGLCALIVVCNVFALLRSFCK